MLCVGLPLRREPLLPNYSETWGRLRARIVRGGVYERTGNMGGAVNGVLHVRDNRVESGQGW